jgi:flagellar basal-body rod modification protein FlgD
MPGVTAMDSSASGTDSGSGSGSDTISANDFLTLLVTEMQNQDPTADTDPNEYINQLVNVNSLQQLISINQTLSTSLGSPGSTTGTSGASGAGSDSLTAPGSVSSPGTARNSALSGAQASVNHSPAQKPSTPLAPGNLSVPNRNPSAERVAQSLNEK